jgi:hypothetical protein
MKLTFPSREFDEAVAAVCHGSATDELMAALNELLRINSAARDEYILRVEVHSRLASEPDLFAPMESGSPAISNVAGRVAITKSLGRFRWRPALL